MIDIRLVFENASYKDLNFFSLYVYLNFIERKNESNTSEKVKDITTQKFTSYKEKQSVSKYRTIRMLLNNFI